MTAIARTPSSPAPARGRPSGSGLGRVFEHRFMTYRRTFRSTIFTSFVTPTLFLAAMGLGLGSYVDSGNTSSLGGISYLVFLAPGLLAASAMNSASFEATFPVMSGLLWSRIFHAMYRLAHLRARHHAGQPRVHRRCG